MPDTRRRVAGYGYMGAAALTWGSLPVILDRAEGSAIVLVALRMGFGAVALGVFLAAFGRRDLLPRHDRPLLAGLGALLALNWVLFFRAIQEIGATAVLIGYLFPLLVPLLAPVLLGERREAHVLPLAAVGFAGLGVMLAREVGAGRPFGAAVALASAVTAALLIIGARRIVATLQGPVIAFWQTFVGALLLLPFAAAAASGGVPWRWGILIGVVHTAVAGVLFFRAVGRIPAQEAGILMYLEPVGAVGFVWAFQAVVPTVWDAVGGALVVGAGIGLVALSARAARQVTPDTGLMGPG